MTMLNPLAGMPMTAPISALPVPASIKPPALPDSLAAATAAAPPQRFQDVLQNSLNQISELNQKAEVAMEQLANGTIQDVHQVMIAMEKANLTFMTMMQVRNKLLQAYNEVTKMQF